MKDLLKIDISRRLITLRNHLGYNQRQMAAKLDMAQISLNRIESGKYYPSAITLQRLSGKFGLSLDWLFRGEGNMFRGKPGAVNVESKKEKSGDIFESDVEEMVYLMRQVPLVRYSMMDHFQRFKVENRAVIDEELSKGKEPG